MSKHHSMEEYCHCGHEVECGRDWSNFDHGHQYIACPYSKMKVWDAPTLGGLIRRAPNGKKTLLLSVIKRMRTLEMRYIT